MSKANTPNAGSRGGLSAASGRFVRELAYRGALLWVLFRDPRTPKKAKLAIFGAFCYFVSPIDAVPDILPFGWFDDAALFGALLARLSGLVTPGMQVRAHKITPRRLRRASVASSSAMAVAEAGDPAGGSVPRRLAPKKERLSAPNLAASAGLCSPKARGAEAR